MNLFFLATDHSLTIFPFHYVDFNGVFGDVEHILLRWLYTDAVELDRRVSKYLLRAAHHYKLPTLFERCEQALITLVDLDSCSNIHEIAKEWNATKLLHHCDRLIRKFWNNLLSNDIKDVDMRMEDDSESSLGEMAVSKPKFVWS